MRTYWIVALSLAYGLIAQTTTLIDPTTDGGFEGSHGWTLVNIPFAIKNLLNGERCSGRSAPSGRSGRGRRPARRAGRRFSMGPPPAFGRRRPSPLHT